MYRLTPFKKILIVILLTAFCSYISLPREIPISLNMFGKSVNRTLFRKDFNLNLGRIMINKNLDLVLGLDLVGGSHLVFEADLSNVAADKKSTALEGVKNVIERRVNMFGISEPSVQTSKYADKDRIIVELPGIKDTGQAVNLIGQTAQLVFAEVSTDLNFIPSDLTGADLKKAVVVFEQTTGSPVISLEFSESGAKKFGELTGRNVGKPLAILLDQNPISSPIVQEQILGGNAQISGDFSLEEAKNLAIQLNAGALPVPVKLVEQRTVGATLGSESVEKSIKAGIIGLLMVLLFMILVYGRFGMIAGLALFVFAVVTLSLYKIIPVVLTLPGVAGFLLTVGMAVDSNILIFERFKEEKIKRPLADALEVSFGRAWDSIRDANIATLLTAFVLANPFDWSFLHTSGPVRGFAITLALGILVSLFTGIVVSRNLMRVLITDLEKTTSSARK